MHDDTKPETTDVQTSKPGAEPFDLQKMRQCGLDHITVMTRDAETGEYRITVCEGPDADTQATAAAAVIIRSRRARKP